jgi:superfamily II DNA or RNA helicase
MLFKLADFARVLLREVNDFGFRSYDLVGYPRRICELDVSPLLVEGNVDSRRVQSVQLPSEIAAAKFLAEQDNWLSASARTLARLYACFLIAEDPQRRLEARKAATLMHQVSLVQHILRHEHLRKVLIGDEVGLGKTIEAGLLVRQLIDRNPSLRVLYLAPARLVSNVATEFREKLDIDARLWIAGPSADARLADDRIVIASIHKAVFGENFDRVVNSGPWDVLIVDECHHLSDWGGGGGSPNQAFRLVSQLAKAQSPEGRLILLSGTPHQGSEARFKNILRLLSEDGKSIEGAAGRVIFRTKDRVRDWKGNPLFPARDIRKPVVVELGEAYEQWYWRVGSLYETAGLNGVQLRAAGWAKGQALQWAASSVQAGLGFLTRLAIRRLNWDLENDALKSAIASLRPYRGGSKDEKLSDLYARLVKQIGSSVLNQLAESDEEELEEEPWRPDPYLLAQLLQEAVALIKSNAARAKWEAVCKLIDESDGEKIVLFAQPVETVTVVADILQQRYGIRPALIIGNQSDEERTAAVASFQADDGPRFLVSSKAGGEGLNMQRARRLIHLDVPWNPMDLEQRIGRVHRFGSRKTIIVDTVVSAGSREIDMYRIAREKLALIARHLDPEQFENLFSRVMSLVPPKELEEILSDTSVPNCFSPILADNIGRLVTEGYRSWNSFDAEYRQQADEIRSANPGNAQWADVAAFMVRFANAKDGSEATFGSFTFEEDEIVAIEEIVPTISLDNKYFSCGETGGLRAICPDGSSAHSLGLNIEEVQVALRKAFAPSRQTGAAFLNRPVKSLLGAGVSEITHIQGFLRQQIHNESGRWSEKSISTHLYVFDEVSAPKELTGKEAADLIRSLTNMQRIKDPSSVSIRADLIDIEKSLIEKLRRPSDEEINQGVRYAVWPLATIILR